MAEKQRKKRVFSQEEKDALSAKIKAAKAAKKAILENEETPSNDTVINTVETEKTVKMENSEKKSEIDDLKDLLLKQAEKHEKEIADLKELINKPATAPQVQQPVIIQNQTERNKQRFGQAVRKEISPEDRLKSQKTYIRAGGLFIMNVYTKDGTEVYAPYDRTIQFTPTNVEIKKDANGNDKIYYFSLYSTFSKKECDYIENSPEWGMCIFDNLQKASKVDPELIEKVRQASEIVNMMDERAILNAAISYSINSEGKSLDYVRAALRDIKVSEILQNEQEVNKKHAENLIFNDLTQK